jgi:hypothetical protein
VPKLSEAFVIGLLSDLEEGVPAVERELSQAKKRASAVDAELGNLLKRLDACKDVMSQAETQISKSGIAVNEKNLRVSTLHQEIATFKKRSDDLKTEMDRVGDGAIQRKLRRERAKATVQIEDREEEIAKLRKDVEVERDKLTKAEATLTAERDRQRTITDELDKLQAQLASPYLYTQLFERLAARAHCRMYLDQDVEKWRAEVRRAVATAVELHHELRAGKYRLDRNSDLIGGRAMASAEAIYAAVALGDRKSAAELFALITDPSLYFHQIFNIFRTWCLGLYVTDRGRELRELLRTHQYSEGLRGGYVQAFIGLLGKDARRFALGLKEIAKHEWELWQDPSLERGAGVVNLGAVALASLAVEAGIQVQVPGPTVPDAIVSGPRRKKLPA